MNQKRTKLIATTSDMFMGGKKYWQPVIDLIPKGEEVFITGWETWVKTKDLADQMEQNDGEIMPEDNKYSINFKLSAFKIVSQ